MLRRARLSPALAVPILLLPGSFAATAEPDRRPPPMIVYQDEAVTRFEALTQEWAVDIGVRFGLSFASCWPPSEPRWQTGCSFEMDGIRATMFKRGTAATAAPRVDLDIGPIIDIGGGVPYARSGGWIKTGDEFEVRAQKTRLAFTCGPAGEGLEVVGCRKQYPDLRAGETPAQYTRRVEVLQEAAGLEVGQAFLDGTIRVLHNARPVNIKRLSEAVRAFAGHDFGQPPVERK